MSISNLSSYWENGHQSEPTESYNGYPRVLAGAQHQWGSTSTEVMVPGFATPSAPKNAATPSLQCSHSTGSAEGHGGRTNVVGPAMSQDPTTSMSQRNNALEDDKHLIQRSAEELRKEADWRIEFVWHVIGKLLKEVRCYDCLKRRGLWLRIIEGNTDDDVWLWADGDEEWLTKQGVPFWGISDPNDWISAQSALRRRIAQQRYPSATGIHGERNERVRNATQKQRVSAIAWLIASSKGVAELFASHGRTPPTFRTPHIASFLSDIIGNYWDTFPSQTNAWENALTTTKEDRCICSPANCRGMREWFNMLVWMGDVPPTLEVGYKSCMHCRSLLKSRYEDIAAKCTGASHVSLLDVFCNYCSSGDGVPFSSRLSPTAKLRGDRILEPLMKKHGLDIRYLLSVNRYPECLRPHVTKLLCGSYINCDDRSPTAELPNNIFDGAHDPWIVVGIIALASGCRLAGKDTDLHNRKWHSYFSSFLRHSLEYFDMPVLPRFSSATLMLCQALDQDCSEERSFGQFDHAMDDSDWVKSDQGGRHLRLGTAVMVAVTSFLRNKDVDLYGCRRCQDFCMESLAGTPSAVTLEVAHSSEHQGHGPPSAHVRSEDDALGGDRSSASQGSLDVGMQEPAGMDAFTTYLRNPTLSKDEVQLRMVTEFLKLRQYLESYGLDPSDCFRRSRPRLEHLLGHGTSSSKLLKSDKVEEIKNKLLEMLREVNLPYERLPWYTLGKDLKKHGCTLVNWPAGVLRKRGNRGIHDLSSVEVNSLYDAITCPDESRRLRICRCPLPLTVMPVQPVNHTPAAVSGLKRPIPEEADLSGHASKIIRFKDMTSKVSQRHLSDHWGDGAAGSYAF